jgi:hypothetical protein
MEPRPSLPAPFKKPPFGGALDVCTYKILNSLLEIPMAVTLRTGRSCLFWPRCANSTAPQPSSLPAQTPRVLARRYREAPFSTFDRALIEREFTYIVFRTFSDP